MNILIISILEPLFLPDGKTFVKQIFKFAFEELLLLSEACATEIVSKRPQVSTRCRECIQRYTTLYAHHFCQEFQQILSPTQSSNVTQSLEEDTLLSCIIFLQSIEHFRKFPFIPRTFFTHFKENLLTDEQLIREYLHILGHEVNQWFLNFQNLQPRHRGHKLTGFQHIIDNSIRNIQNKIEEFRNFPSDADEQTFLIITIETISITAAKHIETMQFNEYGEDALMSHILACHECIRYFTTIRVPSRRYPTSMLPNQESVSDAPVGWLLTLSRTSLEHLSRIFLQSGTTAAKVAVKKMASTLQDLITQFFMEDTKSQWLSGQLCHTYLIRITHWMEHICARGSSTQNEFHRIIHREVIRLVVSTYLSTLISRYRLNKRFKLSELGETRVASDLKEIHQWVVQQNDFIIPNNIQDKGSYSGSNDILMLLRFFRMFITSDQANLMICFIESIQQFGLVVAPHLYDLARLAFKVRSDLTKKQREVILSGFTLFITELSSRTTAEDFRPLSHGHPRLSGAEILSELCPEVGVYHCTGKKWSYETTIDVATRNEVHQFVDEACHVRQIRQSGMSAETVTSPPRYSSILRPNSVVFDEKGLESLLNNSLHELDDGLDSVTLAIDNISFLDGELQADGLTNKPFHLPSFQPFVDFDNNSFEELHLKLRPYFYGDNTWTKPQFTSRAEREDFIDDADDEKLGNDSSSDDEFVGYDSVYASSSLPDCGDMNSG